MRNSRRSALEGIWENVLSVQKNHAGVWHAISRQRFEEFGLPVAGNTGDADDFAGANRQGHVLEYANTALAGPFGPCGTDAVVITGILARVAILASRWSPKRIGCSGPIWEPYASHSV